METTSNPTGALAAALAKAQGEFEPIEKAREVKVNGQTAQGKEYSYTFAYAPLDVVLAATRPALSRNGLALVQLLEDGQATPVLRTLLLHASGERLEARVSLPAKPQKAQDLGSMITYLRRYSIVSILGVVAEEDDDGNAGDGNERDARDRKPAARRQEEPAPKPAPVDDGRTEVAMRLSKLLTAKAPEGLGWTKAGCLGWLKKRFGVEGTPAMSMQQLKDAQLLALAKMTGEKEYEAKVAELASAGRVLGDGEVAA